MLFTNKIPIILRVRLVHITVYRLQTRRFQMFTKGQIILLSFVVFVMSFVPIRLNAQDSNTDLYGAWVHIEDLGGGVFGAGTTYIGFYPNYYMQLFNEHRDEGTYAAANGNISFSGTTSGGGDPSTTSPQNLVSTYTLNGDQLTIGSTTFVRYSKFSGFDANQCPGSLLSRLAVGEFGTVTDTPDNKPTNLRSQPSAKSNKLASMNEGEDFIVIGGPTCAEGYTWWQVWYWGFNLNGWAAEGTSYYFIEPFSSIEKAVSGVSTVPVSSDPVDHSFNCGSALPTNLYIGAFAKVAFESGYWTLPVYSEASQYSKLNGSIEEGVNMNIEDGPICAEGAIWWKVAASYWENGTEGWIPEVTSNSRFVVRLSKDSGDSSAVFDPLANLGSGPWHIEPQIQLRVYSDATTQSAVLSVISPGVAYEVTGQNASSGMLRISSGWVCGDIGHVRYDQRFHQLPVVNSSQYNCQPSDYSFSTDDLFTQAGAKRYEPGQYPHEAELSAAIGDTPIASTLVDMTGYVMFVKDVSSGEAGGIDLICSMFNIWSIGSTMTNGAFPEPDKDTSVACILFDFGKNVLLGEPLAGSAFIMAEIVANPDKYIDPWLTKVNEFTDSMPLTRVYCHFNPDICVGGPGSVQSTPVG